MRDWNKDGKIDAQDHWITYQVYQDYKQKQEKKPPTSYQPPKPCNPEIEKKNAERLNRMLCRVILLDIVLVAILYFLRSL